MNADQPIRVLLVDDQTLVRQGIRSLLTLAAQIEVVAEAGDGIEALAAIEETRPDVVLLDLSKVVNASTGGRKSRWANALSVPTPSRRGDDEAVLDVLRFGARGYLLKDVTLDELVNAIETLARGDRLVKPAVTAALLERLADRPAAHVEHPAAQALTTRELEILELMAGGFANREIARALHLAEGTVKNHVSSILLKLGAGDRTRAVLRSLELGLFRRGAG